MRRHGFSIATPAFEARYFLAKMLNSLSGNICSCHRLSRGIFYQALVSNPGIGGIDAEQSIRIQAENGC